MASTSRCWLMGFSRQSTAPAETPALRVDRRLYHDETGMMTIGVWALFRRSSNSKRHHGHLNVQENDIGETNEILSSAVRRYPLARDLHATQGLEFSRRIFLARVHRRQ